jgi:hypothetical protein
MPRKRQCSSCLYYMKIPKNLRNKSVVFDGWCQHYEEERDRDEQICEAYKATVFRRTSGSVKPC